MKIHLEVKETDPAGSIPTERTVRIYVGHVLHILPLSFLERPEGAEIEVPS